jgi:predicted pyridoxine 5'-phosphate oxidase superfamily flavin-nucleotide-binding protein
MGYLTSPKAYHGFTHSVCAVCDLVKVSPEVRTVFEKQHVIPMATADSKARPNVILVGMWFWADDETLVVSDNYLNKTKANLRENPVVAFNGWADGKSYQIKCQVKWETSGPRFEQVRKMATSETRQFPGKAAVVCAVEEIFQGNGGDGAGKKLG